MKMWICVVLGIVLAIAYKGYKTYKTKKLAKKLEELNVVEKKDNNIKDNK